MFTCTKVCSALFAAMAANAWAQAAAPESTQRVEITSSSIRRIEADGALPVTLISRDAIDKTGVTSVTVEVDVYAQRQRLDAEIVKVTEATLTYVATDDARHSRPLPPL